MPILQDSTDPTKDHPQKGTAGAGHMYLMGYDPAATVNPLDVGSTRDEVRSKVHFLGWVDSVPNTVVDMWYNGTATPTQYVFPTTGIQMQVVSTSVQDKGTVTVGTGIQVVEIHYLDTALMDKTTLVTVNGTTAATTSVSDIFRIQEFHTSGTSAGTSKSAVGDVRLQAVGGAITYAVIPIGWNRANLVTYTVPATKTISIKHWSFSSGASTGSHFTKLWLLSTCDYESNLTPGIFHFHSLGGTLNSSTELDIDVPHRFPAGTDIKVSVQADSGTVVGASSEIIGWLE